MPCIEHGGVVRVDAVRQPGPAPNDRSPASIVGRVDDRLTSDRGKASREAMYQTFLDGSGALNHA